MPHVANTHNETTSSSFHVKNHNSTVWLCKVLTKPQNSMQDTLRRIRALMYGLLPSNIKHWVEIKWKPASRDFKGCAQLHDRTQIADSIHQTTDKSKHGYYLGFNVWHQQMWTTTYGEMCHLLAMRCSLPLHECVIKRTVARIVWKLLRFLCDTIEIVPKNILKWKLLIRNKNWNAWMITWEMKHSSE